MLNAQESAGPLGPRYSPPRNVHRQPGELEKPEAPDEAALRVESTTWNRDSHELFDYESRHIFTRQFLLRKAARVFRSILDVSVIADGSDLPANADYLLSIRAREGRYFVYPADRSACQGGQNLQPRKLWLITKHLRGGTYPLSEGDVIKLGRFKLRVKQMVTETALAAPVDFKLDDVEVPASDLTPEESQHMQCRICLLEGGNDEDPLVRACQCKGSIMYIHLACLQHWVNGRLNLNEDPSRSCCFVRQLTCELCKSPFPSSVVNRGVRFNVVKVPNVQPPFIVLENLVGPTNRGVHLCSMAVKKECKLGRGHESDVRIADVSISRFHAMIRYQDGAFLLEDHASKFGTLVALRRPTMIERESTLAVQVGRTVLQFSIEDIPVAWLSDDVVEMPEKKDNAGQPAWNVEDTANTWGSPAAGEASESQPPPAGPIPPDQRPPGVDSAVVLGSAPPETANTVDDVLRAFHLTRSGDMFDPVTLLNLTGGNNLMGGAAQGTPLPARYPPASSAIVQGQRVSSNMINLDEVPAGQPLMAYPYIPSESADCPSSFVPHEPSQVVSHPMAIPTAQGPPADSIVDARTFVATGAPIMPPGDYASAADPQEAFASMLQAANLLPSSQQQQRHLLLSALAVQFDLLQRQAAQPQVQQPAPSPPVHGNPLLVGEEAAGNVAPGGEDASD